METFFIIHSWMISKLHLSGLKLQVYAIIYGFSKDGCSRFSGSISYLQNCTGGSRQGVISALKALTDAGLLEKSERTASRVTLYDYKATARSEFKSQEVNLKLGNESLPAPSQKRYDKFSPPTLQEVQEYCKKRNNCINAQSFVDFYESKGWMIGKNKMKSWEAAVRTWECRSKSSSEAKNHPESTVGVGDYLP
jgi:hypothetical protein